jgi:hypothetical protein
MLPLSFGSKKGGNNGGNKAAPSWAMSDDDDDDKPKLTSPRGMRLSSIAATTDLPSRAASTKTATS